MLPVGRRISFLEQFHVPGVIQRLDIIFIVVDFKQRESVSAQRRQQIFSGDADVMQSGRIIFDYHFQIRIQQDVFRAGQDIQFGALDVDFDE